MPQRAVIEDFLAQRRLMFVGASRDPKSFNTTVYRAMREHGFEMVPVHPEADAIEGDRAYPAATAVPGPIDGAVVMVPADASADVVRQCVTAGVRRVWLYRGVGKGSVSEEAVAVARQAGVAVVDGACPFMFMEPVRGIHRMHRVVSVRRIAA